MAIDPRQFSVPPAGAASQKNQNLVKRSQDLLRNTRSLSDIPNIVNNQVNSTINLVTKRFPERIENAATNIAINAVSSAALGAFQGFATGGIVGAITGSVSQGFDGIVGDVLGATDQILAQTGSDLGTGIAGITNNIGGGVLTKLANPLIANLKELSAGTVFEALGDAGSTISGLFGGDGFVSDEAAVASEFTKPQSDYDKLGVDSSSLNNCQQDTRQVADDIADTLAFEVDLFQNDLQNGGLDPSFTQSKSTDLVQDITDLQTIVDDVSIQCPPVSEATTIERLPKHYASNLVPFHQPKFKFMFMVELVFHPEYQQMLSSSVWNVKNEFEFVIKNSSRPNVSFEHEEINMYNYWTKVPKRTIYEPMTMRFYDDNANSSNSFYTNYMRAMSPIANVGGDGSMVYPQQYQENSMSPEAVIRPDTVDNLKGGASLGALNNNATNILSEIRLYHLYDWGRLLNVYHMYNPKITNMNLDDLDMAESGAGSELEVQFAYDGLYVEKSKKTTVELMAKITGKMIGAGYEIDPIYDNDENDAKGVDGFESEFTDISLPGSTPIAGASDTAAGVWENVSQPPGTF